MKIMIEIECSPQEARSFFGLPDVEAMQRGIMEETGKRLREALAGSDAETLMRTWMPAGVEGFEQLQKMFWGVAKGGGERGEKS